MNDVHVKFPSEVMARLRARHRQTGIPVSHLVRKSVMDEYGGVDVVPEAVTNPEQDTRIMHNESTDGE